MRSNNFFGFIVLLHLILLCSCSQAKVDQPKQPQSSPIPITTAASPSPLPVRSLEDGQLVTESISTTPVPIPKEKLTALLTQIDRSNYNPITNGLRSLRVEMIDAKGGFQSPTKELMRLMLYWQAPDKRRVRFESVDGTVITNSSQEFMFNEGIDMLAQIVPLPFNQRATICVGYSEPDPTATRILVKPPTWDLVQEERVYQFDKDYLPIKSFTAHPAMFSHTDQYEYQVKSGAKLLTKITRRSRTDMGNSMIEITIDYAQSKGYWLPSKIGIGQNNQQIFFEFKDYRINETIPFGVFK